MKISYNWLKELVDIKITPAKLAELLTMHSFEVENVIYQGKRLDGVVVGEILEIQNHPNADKLSVVKVDVGKKLSLRGAKLSDSETERRSNPAATRNDSSYGIASPAARNDSVLDIVCGAPNVKVRQKVAVALAGAQLPCGLKIEKRKVRGVESCGMICAEDELGLGKSHKGIMILDKSLKVGTPLAKALGLDDVIFEIDILPNRAHDCLSHIGVAREVAAILKLKVKSMSSRSIGGEKLKVKVKNLKFNELLSVKVENPKLCRRYSAVTVKNIKVKKSPQWLKNKLLNCGVRPVNNIVDITNYVMLALGQPMHVFDYDKIGVNSKSEILNSKQITNHKLQITNKSQIPNPKQIPISNIQYPISNKISNLKSQTKIIIRRAQKEEKILVLDGNEYKLDVNDLVIADGIKPIAIAGIMGGAETAVDENTKNIIFESANFEGIGVRKTSRRLKLASESSYRFEREIDPELTMKAIEMAVKMVEDLAGEKPRGNIVDIYPSPVKARKIKFEFARIKNLLGIEVKKAEIKRILGSLGFKVWEKGNNLEIEVPTYRVDVEAANDVIEEIARIYGYKNIPESPAVIKMKSVTQNKDLELEKNVKKILEGLGFAEVYNYSFISEKDIKGIGLESKNHLELQNPLSEEFKFMRTSLLSGLLKNARQNLKHKNKFKLFELGRVYLKSDKQKIAYRLHNPKGTMEPTWSNSDLPNERKILAGINVDENKKNTLFYEIKGQIETLLGKLGFDSLVYKEIDDSESLWHKGRSAEIYHQEKVVGKMGEIHPIVLNGFNLELRIVYFELYFESLASFYSGDKKYKKINRFPAIKLDLSVVFDEDVKWEEIMKVILSIDSELIKNIEPFDIYRGDKLSRRKKSIAFRIFYQAENRTLKDEEVMAVQEKVIKELEKLGGKVRK